VEVAVEHAVPARGEVYEESSASESSESAQVFNLDKSTIQDLRLWMMRDKG